jgi:hypothetical protein
MRISPAEIRKQPLESCLFVLYIRADGAGEGGFSVPYRRVFAADCGNMAHESREIPWYCVRICCKFAAKTAKWAGSEEPPQPANSLQKQVNVGLAHYHFGPLTPASAKVAIPA